MDNFGPSWTSPLGPGDREPEAGTAGQPFSQGEWADALPPGPIVVGLTDHAVTGFDCLSDDELVGVLRAARRQQAREQYKQVLAMAEFGRRRMAAVDDAKRRGAPPGCRPGEFPGEELAIELVSTRGEAANRIENAQHLTARLPATLAGMAAGLIDEDRAAWICYHTRSLSPADAAHADQVLAAAAPDLRTDQLARKAAALEMKLALDAVRARKQHEKRTNQRVEARREFSGNASLAAREMDTADAMASKAYIDALAARLRDGGLAAPIGTLRVLAMTDLTQGRDPLDRLKPAPADDPASAAPCDGQTAPDPSGRPPSAAKPGPGDFAPLPASVNLLIPVGTLLGWCTAPAQAGTWGLLDADEARAAVTAAARHPRTRWCVTLTNDKREAVAHGCARGQHPGLLDDLQPQPPPGQLEGLLRRLGITAEALIPIARRGRDHAHAEAGYVPSRTLRHLIRARTATCDAPGCAVQSTRCDLDHTVPYPAGPTAESNLGPKCRTHHRVKQAPGWQVEQVEPGVICWTLPSGRTHVTAPTVYEL